MKIAISKRGKLLILVIPTMLVLSVSFYGVFPGDKLQADYDEIQPGMTLQEVSKILEKDKIESAHIRISFSAGEPPREVYKEVDSVLLPGGSIWVGIDENDRILKKGIQRPGIQAIWNHWKRQLGL